MLSVRNSGTGFVLLPRPRGLTVWNLSDVRILHDHTRAGVPSQNGVVVSGYRKVHSSLIMIHCFSKRVIRGCAGSGPAVTYARISQTLPDDAVVVGPLIVALNLGENLAGGFHIHMRMELVGARQQKRNQRLLMVGYDGQDIEADALGKAGFVQ